MKTILNLLIFVLAISFTSCGDKDPDYCDGGWDMRLTIFNNSKTGIYVIHSAAYPDTNSYNSISDYTTSRRGINYVSSNSENIQGERCTWYDYFNNYVLNDTLMIFIIQDDNQDGSFPLDIKGLIEHHTVLKRYDLSIYDLENMDWTITYP